MDALARKTKPVAFAVSPSNGSKHEYIVKGFALDDERLKGGVGLVDYFDELLARRNGFRRP